MYENITTNIILYYDGQIKKQPARHSFNFFYLIYYEIASYDEITYILFFVILV